MLKRIGLIGLTSAALTLAYVACGESLTPGHGCNTDGDCNSNQICHPQAKVCVQTCSTSSDCPDSAKTCEALGPVAGADGGASTQICKCSTDQLCATENARTICSSAFRVCVNACNTNADCPVGLTCDVSNGQCFSGGTDGGADAGACAWDNCSTQAFTGATGKQCTASGCTTGPACMGTGRSSCEYGAFCAQGACGFPPFPTRTACQNFYSGAHPNGPVWSPTGGTNGPVIYQVEQISHAQGTGSGSPSDPFGQCTTSQTQWNIRVRAYNPNGWPPTRAGISGFFYVDTTGKNTDVIASTLLLESRYKRNPNDPNDAEFDVYACPTNAMNAFQPGYFFTGGNEACAQF